MKHVLLLMMVAGVGHALLSAGETKCNATRDSSLCSSARGGTVYMQVMTNASGHRLQCKKQLPTGSINVFTLKKEKVMIWDSFRNKTEFFIHNGTLKISNVEKKDSGQYNIEIFNLNGFLLRNIEVKLDVHGPPVFRLEDPSAPGVVVDGGCRGLSHGFLVEVGVCSISPLVPVPVSSGCGQRSAPGADGSSDENTSLILIAACSAAAVLLVVVAVCCVCQRSRRKKKARKKAQAKNQTSLFSSTPDLNELC